MSYSKRLEQAFSKAPELSLTSESKYVIMSDCHRGVGNTSDNFLKNELIFLSALQTYYNEGFTYIELGDGDELWKNRSVKAIQEAYEDIFRLMRKFDCDNRLCLLVGNHDLEKLCRNYDDGFKYHEGIILKDSHSSKLIHITHGHQADSLNSTFWRLSRFLIRYVWKPLEMYGISNPISAANNNEVKEKVERRLRNWAIDRNRVLICGHTHRAVMGNKASPYFNSGCCLYPGSITALEIENRKITLFKWKFGIDNEYRICISKEALSDAVSIDDVFRK